MEHIKMLNRYATDVLAMIRDTVWSHCDVVARLDAADGKSVLNPSIRQIK
jgi:hypothetical protein